MNAPLTAPASKIAELNDRFRRTMSDELGQRFFTRGIEALGIGAMFAITERVMTFDHFPEGDDPYGEHDFGAFDYEGRRIFWKIDYYDRASFGTGRDFGSEDPADPAKTLRVLTVMLADEY